MGRVTATSEILREFGTGRTLALGIAAVATMLLSAVGHQNAWHLLGAAAFVCILLTLRAVSDARSRVANPLVRRIAPIIDQFGVLVLVAAIYVPYTILTLLGAPGYESVALIGALLLLWSVLDRLIAYRGQALVTVATVMAGWLAIAIAEPWIAQMHPGVVLVLLATILAYSTFAVTRALQHAPSQWSRWQLYAVWALLSIVWPEARERFGGGEPPVL